MITQLRLRVGLLVLCLSTGLLPAVGLAAGDGAKIYNEYLEKEVIYPDEDWQDYVTEIGERLLAVSAHAGRNYTFVVTDEPFVNAYATGDAYIFVSRGILAHFRSEDELAAVIGHEIGHVLGRHTKRRNRGLLYGKMLGWLGLIGTSTTSAYGLSQTLTAATLAGYGRQFELEADEYGVDLVTKAGYNPRAMLDSIQMLRDNDDFERTIKNRPTVYHGILGSHPAHEKRLHELVERSQHLFPDELAEPERDFYAMLEGLTFGDEAATGVVKDGVYYHGALRLLIKFPENWDVRATPSEVFGVPPVGGPNAEINVKRQSPPDEEQTPEEYLTKTLRRDDLENGEEIQIGAYPGYLAEVAVAGATPLKRMIAVVYKDGGVYLFNGELTAGADPEAFAQAFRETVMSFRAMTAADLRLVNNQKLKIIVAEPGQTYAELARGVPLKVHGEETLRVINGHHPRGEPRAGDYVKLIE